MSHHLVSHFDACNAPKKEGWSLWIVLVDAFILRVTESFYSLEKTNEVGISFKFVEEWKKSTLMNRSLENLVISVFQTYYA